ncbi:hypothetical protein B0H14DRAFT_2584653 [Mycena olivaceomarginata]|nr:hypothetical protein B0H14DRAFT_2584653 [Mycena olivaceomarginata]
MADNVRVMFDLKLSTSGGFSQAWAKNLADFGGPETLGTSHSGPNMILDEVQYTLTSTPVAQAASPAVPYRLLQTMYNLQGLYARLYMASATSVTIYEQGWAFDEASNIIGHSTYHRLRHARAFRFTYLQPRPIMYWNQSDPMGLGKGLTEVPVATMNGKYGRSQLLP